MRTKISDLTSPRVVGRLEKCFKLHSTGHSKAVVLVLFLLFVVLCSFVVPALLSVFFPIYVVMLALWSPSSIATHFAFCFTNCVVMLAFWSASIAAHFAYYFTSFD